MKINCKVKWQVLTEEDTELHQKKASKEYLNHMQSQWESYIK